MTFVVVVIAISVDLRGEMVTKIHKSDTIIVKITSKGFIVPFLAFWLVFCGYIVHYFVMSNVNAWQYSRFSFSFYLILQRYQRWKELIKCDVLYVHSAAQKILFLAIKFAFFFISNKQTSS
jgi:hypothetical protein